MNREHQGVKDEGKDRNRKTDIHEACVACVFSVGTAKMDNMSLFNKAVDT